MGNGHVVWEVLQCFVVSTLASTTPAAPFVLRNYEHSATGAAIAARLGACPRGSSSFSVWQAIRASSAAPYYLADFNHNGNRYALCCHPQLFFRPGVCISLYRYLASKQ